MRALVDVLQIENELGEIFDRINIVVRRRRDQRDAGRRVAHRGDDFVDLVTGKLTAFSRLRALRHLDLELVGVDEVLRGHAEARRGHLLHGAAPQIAAGVGDESLGLLASLAGVGFSADPIHGDGEVLVRLLGNTPK